jgi:hypothetical protein
MVTWTKILAAMLFLQAPGKSAYSRVSVDEKSGPSVISSVNGVTAYSLLEDGAEQPTQCQQEGNIACSKPALRDVTYNGKRVKTAWQRIETYDEGLQRYALIAKSMEEVLESQKWNFPAGRSWRYLVTIAFHESGFRRDVHSGLGSAALGDCAWRKTEKGKSLIPGSCRSHGLFQFLFRDPKTTVLYGYRSKHVIGLDEGATKRAAMVAVRHLDRMYHYCRYRGPRPFAACIFATYGGVSATKDPRIQARLRTFGKLRHAPTLLDSHVSKALGVPRVDKLAQN